MLQREGLDGCRGRGRRKGAGTESCAACGEPAAFKQSLLALLMGVVFFIGCGRYRPPIAPEQLAPAAVEGLVVTASDNSVNFTWIASDVDRRGKELKSVEGYSVEKKELVHRGDETDPSIRFEQIGFLEDDHVVVRDRLREEARAAGKIGRRVKAPTENLSFSYTDTTPVSGKTYLYQIVPRNQGGVEGQVGQVVKVVFQGVQSTIVVSASEEAANQLAAASIP